jgi:long-chain acyl-CoA synthetase
MLTNSIPWDINAPGTCGQIQPCNELKLVDVPEMGVSVFALVVDTADPSIPVTTSQTLVESEWHVYQADYELTPRLCLKGSNITPGYLHDPENTAKTIDADGWMHTGE